MSRPLAPALLLALSAFAAGPPASPPAASGCGGTYQVVRGDTLYAIARRCGSSVAAIARASRLADPRRIEIGRLLTIPGPDVPFPRAADKPEPVADPQTGQAYRFQPGDTLYSLARWARVGVPALLAANPGIDPQKIEIGDAVRLPAGAATPDAARLRERGTGPGPALVRPNDGSLRRAPPPRVEVQRPRAAPPPPRGAKPEEEDEPQPEGM